MATTTTIEPQELQQLLAHRYPFLLVDRIDVLEPGRRVVGLKRVTGGEWASGPTAIAEPAGHVGWHEGLYMPGLVVVEALAQTSAALLVDLLDRSAGVIGYFAAMERVRLREPARPGDTLRLALELRSFRRSIAKLRGVATRDDGRLVASADFTCVVRPGTP